MKVSQICLLSVLSFSTRALTCAMDNCYINVEAASGSAFCASFTTKIVLVTNTLPAFLSKCSTNSLAKLSTDCSCIWPHQTTTTTTTTTSTTSTTTTTTTSSTTRTANWQQATLSPGNNYYAQAGVYSNGNGNLLNYPVPPVLSVTSIEVRLDICLEFGQDFGFPNGFAYAGIQNYGQCLCGACNGNPWKYCGDPQHVVLYALRPVPLVPANITTPIIPPGDANYNFFATYTDSTGLGIFSGEASAASDLVTYFSVESCLDACFSGGNSVYQYAGVENGVTCYCGNGWNPGSETQVSQSEANVQCIGNAYQLCGGVSVIQIYTVSGATIPVTAATTTTRS